MNKDNKYLNKIVALCQFFLQKNSTI